MIEIVIKRKCRHFEKIAVMGFSGNLCDISIQYQAEISNNIVWQENKLCLPCFEKLPIEEKQRLLKEVTNQ